jgi:hypothetical protein
MLADYMDHMDGGTLVAITLIACFGIPAITIVIVSIRRAVAHRASYQVSVRKGIASTVFALINIAVVLLHIYTLFVDAPAGRTQTATYIVTHGFGTGTTFEVTDTTGDYPILYLYDIIVPIAVITYCAKDWVGTSASSATQRGSLLPAVLLGGIGYQQMTTRGWTRDFNLRFVIFMKLIVFVAGVTSLFLAPFYLSLLFCSPVLLWWWRDVVLAAKR